MRAVLQTLTRRTLSIVAATATAFGIVAASSVANTPEADAVPRCAPVILFAVPGTMGTSPLHTTTMSDNGLMRGVVEGTKARLGGRVVTQYVPYAATAGTMMSYNQSKNQGVHRLRSMLASASRQCPNSKFALSGYSQGAHVAGQVTHSIGHGRGPIPADKLIATGLIADPQRGTDGEKMYGTAPRGSFGILAKRENGWGKASGKVVNVCNLGDIYCDSAPSYRAMAGGVLDRRAFVQPVTSSEAGGRANDAGLTSVAILNGLLGAAVWHQSYHASMPGQRHSGVSEVTNFISHRAN